MVAMINVRFGNMMMVDESRVDEYLAQGNIIVGQLAPKSDKPKATPSKKPARKGGAKK